MTRPLTETERMVVSRMAETLADSKRAQIMADLAQAIAAPMNDAGTIIRFEIPGYQHPPKSARQDRPIGPLYYIAGAHPVRVGGLPDHFEISNSSREGS